MSDPSEEMDGLINELINLTGTPDDKKERAYQNYLTLSRDTILDRIAEFDQMHIDVEAYRRHRTTGAVLAKPDVT